MLLELMYKKLQLHIYTAQQAEIHNAKLEAILVNTSYFYKLIFG